jgi:uncharacterized membrane protein
MRIERRVWLLSGGAFVLYGAIAAAVNQDHGADAALRASGVQGFSSFVTTFTMSAVIDAVHQLLARRLGATKTAAVGAAATGVVVAAGQHVALNIAARTPALWATVAVPIGAAVIYSVLYAAAAHRRTLRAHSAAPTTTRTAG